MAECPLLHKLRLGLILLNSMEVELKDIQALISVYNNLHVDVKVRSSNHRSETFVLSTLDAACYAPKLN